MTDETTTLAPAEANGTDSEDTPTLTIPRLEVTLRDGRVLTVQVFNADLVRLDRTAAKHRWPSTTQAPFLAQTFLAWSALRRTGGIPQDMTWEAFESTEAVQVRDAPKATNGTGPEDVVAPFPPEAVAG